MDSKGHGGEVFFRQIGGLGRGAATLAAAAALIVLVGCGDDSTTIFEATIPATVTVTPTAVDTGHKVDVSVSATGPGGPLTYTWMAAAGRFSDATADSTSWTAPDDPGTYSLTVVVSDGTNVGIDAANVTVSQYVPTDTPSYRGAEVCAGCHAEDTAPGGNQYGPWSDTAHAHAIESLRAIGQDENPNCVVCHTVGSYGLFADETLDNGGYDETAVERLEGVQCENCHGPGSQHPNPSFGSVEATLDAAVCGNCHTDEHHPTYDEWLESLHSIPVEFAAGRASCAKCHNGVEAVHYLDDPQNYVQPASDPTEIFPQTCAVCHDPHGNDNPGNLRNASVTDVILPNSVLVEEAGAGRLCMSCHNGRRQDYDVIEQIDEGSSHFGPHHSVQGDMLKGVNAYEDVAPAFTFASSKHILVQDACVTCHTHAHEGDLEHGIPNFTGHNFEPTVEACQPCHGTLTDFTDVLAKEDYDGDGTVEGVQEEVVGLQNILKATIIAASQSPEAEAAFNDDFEGALGDVAVSTREQREAGYNWAFVEFDGSSGVHNATYAIQLLQKSIEYLDPSALPASAVILVQVD
jgi:hypothetical protein